MPAQTAFIAAADPIHPGVNSSMLQEGPVVADVYDAMADDDTSVITIATAGDSRVPPRAVQVYRHTGGDITSAVAATRAMSNGDTAEFQIDIKGDTTITRFTHTFVGLTGGAATPAQIAASINGDTAISPYVKAVASLTANAVTLFAIRPRSSVVVGAQPAVLGFVGAADYKKRTYVNQTMHILGGTTGFSWSFNANTGAVTVQNETGGAVNRVFVIIDR